MALENHDLLACNAFEHAHYTSFSPLPALLKCIDIVRIILIKMAARVMKNGGWKRSWFIACDKHIVYAPYNVFTSC